MNAGSGLRTAAVLLFVGVVIIIGLGLNTAARTIQVPGDYNTLQRAVNAAHSGDKIVLTTRARRLYENIEFRNDRRITITTSSRIRKVTINGRRRDKPTVSLTNCS